eukprot:7307096-Prymnesium_polylepis.1
MRVRVVPRNTTTRRPRVAMRLCPRDVTTPPPPLHKNGAGERVSWQQHTPTGASQGRYGGGRVCCIGVLHDARPR